MESDDFIKKDFLRNLIQKSSPDNPSDAFVERIMGKVQQAPEFSVSRRPFYLYLWSVIPMFLLFVIVLLFLFTSDLPLGKIFPEKDYFTQTAMSYLIFLVHSFKMLVASKYISFAFIIVFAAGILVFIEYVFSGKAKEFFLSKGL